ncbi:MAG: transglycosylase SLT domain-containing protein [Desulfomonilaceae bacterium]|nr:transglycosylase SLT domain-containing protein [Desulfomonilaceae bacterium]
MDIGTRIAGHKGFKWTAAMLGGAAILLLGIGSSFPSSKNAGSYSRAHYVFPPQVKEKGLKFAGVPIPLDRRDVAERVVDQINYLLMDRRAGTMQVFDRMAVYGPMMKKILHDEKIPADLIYLSALVSSLLPNATTRSGGVGWWALGSANQKSGPSAGQWVSTNDWDDRRDPVLSTRIASTIMQGLRKRYSNADWLLVAAAFVDGADTIDAVAKKAPGFSYWDMVMPPYSEILVPRLVALKIIDTHRQFYGVDIRPMSPLQYDFLDRLKLEKDLPLHVVAKWCRTNPRALWEINPGVDPSSGVLPKPDKRSPSGFPLRVPKGNGKTVRMMLQRDGYLSK